MTIQTIEGNPGSEISPETLSCIAQLLGRTPRGLEAVVVVGAEDQTMVIRVASLVDGKPFPNLFWLIDPDLVYRIDCDEARGLIQILQGQVDSAPALQRQMVADHRAHIDLRNAYMTPAVERQLRASQFYAVMQQRGIGGIADFSRIRCLHTWYAAHLVVPNTVGRLLARHWADIDRSELAT